MGKSLRNRRLDSRRSRWCCPAWHAAVRRADRLRRAAPLPPRPSTSAAPAGRPPGAHGALQLALGRGGHMVEERHRRQHARAHRRDGARPRRCGHARLRGARPGRVPALRSAGPGTSRRPGPAGAGRRRRAPSDERLAPRGFVAGRSGSRAPVRSPLGHGGVARDQRFELLPARDCALAFAAQQAQPGRPQEQPGMLGGDRHRVVALGRRPGAPRTRATRKARRSQRCPSVHDCVIATHRPRGRPHRAPPLAGKIADNQKGLKAIDTWLSDCYLWF